VKENRPGISKYFIAIIPPSPIYEEANKWKEFFRDEFHSKGALQSPPHITLHMPFEWKTSKEEILKEALRKFSLEQKPFEISLSNYGCFEPRVIFMAVAENPDLITLQAELFRFCKTELNLFNANRQDKPFHPHLTVASRDLKKSNFPAAWESMKEKKFTSNFLVNELVLLRHDGKLWQAHERFGFAP
jgi:2'-5' RNA ligase